MDRELTQLSRELIVLLEDPRSVNHQDHLPRTLAPGDPKSLASAGTCTSTHRQNT